MSQTLTIARRELTSLFYSPIAYVVLGLFALGSTMIFMLTFFPGGPAELRTTFRGIVWLMIFLVPAISMRLISEELRAGTIEPLMTAPISDMQVIVGKWLGAMGFFAVLLAPLLVFTGVLEVYGSPDYGPIFTGLLGLLLVGGLYLAIGTFASAASQNQIIAFILSVFIISLLSIVLLLVSRASWVSSDWQQALLHANVDHHFDDFNKGLIDLTNFVYFASGITLFLFLAVKLLESKRWR